MLPSELTNTIEQFIVCSSELSTFHLDLYHTNVFEADNVYKKPSPKVISPIFLFHFGAPSMTLLTAGELTDPYRALPAIASVMCTTDARPGGVGRCPPPTNKNPGYAGESTKRCMIILACDSMPGVNATTRSHLPHGW